MRRVAAAGLSLAVCERGAVGRPHVLLVHGFPDSQTLWRPVAERLAGEHHVVSYDLRGAGASQRPSGRRPYALENLVADARAVIDATAGGEPVHLVGHDWGAIQGWEFLYAPPTAGRIASFTCINGACFDHVGVLVRERLRHPAPGRLIATADQLRRSWYMLALQARWGFAPLWRWVIAPRWAALLESREKLEPAADFPAPTLAGDGASLAGLYWRTPFERLLFPRRTAPVDVPVQVIRGERDPYLAASTLVGIERFAPRLTRHTVPGGHWLPRTHPELIAELVAAHVARHSA